ncbi:hypothetical protein CEXT_92001 [Caerostris extrusa]|uniref:Uncharacterized protein n=1 Tax=Caerostris extrusa TaxID=172846 RepID=A0AAV4UEK6_CAEEX|nr:hypothetical protein CEXT_92001 [Caerostris extrusa]
MRGFSHSKCIFKTKQGHTISGGGHRIADFIASVSSHHKTQLFSLTQELALCSIGCFETLAYKKATNTSIHYTTLQYKQSGCPLPYRGQMPNDLEFILCASISTTNYGTVLLLKGVGVVDYRTESGFSKYKSRKF